MKVFLRIINPNWNIRAPKWRNLPQKGFLEQLSLTGREYLEAFLAVFCHRAARHLDALGSQGVGDGLVREGLFLVLAVHQVLDGLEDPGLNFF